MNDLRFQSTAQWYFIERFPRPGIYSYVLTVRRMVLVLLALIWLPAQEHCLLERSGIELISDCCAETLSAAPSHSPCSANICCKLHSDSYHVETLRKIELTAGTQVFSLGLSQLSETPPTGMSKSGFQTTSPPDFLVTWQFSHRTALPSRAPSIVV